MYEVNIYINFSNGVPLIFVDEKEYPINKLNFGKFITKAEQKNIY
jgi:hypothetical protein